MKKLLIFGGGGYTGSVLIPDLLKKNYEVIVFDTFWYGTQHLENIKNDKLKLIEGDVRDLKKISDTLIKYKPEMVLHLACISNDASFELNESLSTTINLDSFEPLVLECKNKNVNRFVFASSSSVYGVSEHKNVTEEHPLVPLTLYNKYKGLCEPKLLENTDENFIGVVFRPATVCGFGPRLRLDLSVNILTHHAIKNKKIKVFGGSQLRPNLHIKDYSRVCQLLLESPESSIKNQIFNVGQENLSILDLAHIIKKIVIKNFGYEDIPIEITESNDSRSYHINSDKIYQTLGFTPLYNVEDAVNDLCEAFKKELKNEDTDNVKFYNVKQMLKLNVS